MRTRTALVAGVALLLAGTVAAPAQAERWSIDDPDDASDSLTDIYGVDVQHGGKNLIVKVRFNELVRSSAAGVSIFIDTNRSSQGPELVLGSGLGDGTDYALMEARGWQGSEVRVGCDYKARPKWGKDLFWALIDRDCLDDARAVRVSVKMVDEADGTTSVTDWAPRRQRWSVPVASGTSA